MKVGIAVSPMVTVKRMSGNAMSYRFYCGDVCRERDDHKERDVGIRQEGMPGDLLPDMPSLPLSAYVRGQRLSSSALPTVMVSAEKVIAMVIGVSFSTFSVSL